MFNLIPIAAGLIGGLFGRGRGGGNNNSRSGQQGGAQMQDILPLLMPLLQQSQQASQQSYNMQMQRYTDAEPLRASVMRMTNAILPNAYRMPEATASRFQPLQLPPMEELLRDRNRGDARGYLQQFLADRFGSSVATQAMSHVDQMPIFTTGALRPRGQ